MDNVDNCPLVPNPAQIDTNGNGKGDACEDDYDGDGIADPQDNCPNNGLIFNTDFRGIQAITLVCNLSFLIIVLTNALVIVSKGRSLSWKGMRIKILKKPLDIKIAYHRFDMPRNLGVQLKCGRRAN